MCPVAAALSAGLFRRLERYQPAAVVRHRRWTPIGADSIVRGPKAAPAPISGLAGGLIVNGTLRLAGGHATLFSGVKQGGRGGLTALQRPLSAAPILELLSETGGRQQSGSRCLHRRLGGGGAEDLKHQSGNRQCHCAGHAERACRRP